MIRNNDDDGDQDDYNNENEIDFQEFDDDLNGLNKIVIDNKHQFKIQQEQQRDANEKKRNLNFCK